jgi:hypothetical protein
MKIPHIVVFALVSTGFAFAQDTAGVGAVRGSVSEQDSEVPLEGCAGGPTRREPGAGRPYFQRSFRPVRGRNDSERSPLVSPGGVA